MTYALKSSGLATALVACVMVDDDGTTIKEFKGNTSGTISGAVTVGTSTWKGVSRKYFETLANGSFDFFGIKWTNSNGPQVNFADSDGASLFCAFAGSGVGNPKKLWVSFQEDVNGLAVTPAGKAQLNFGGNGAVTTTTIPTDGTTKFSVGSSWRGNNVSPQHSEIFYGAESGNLASEQATNPGEFGGLVRLTGIGGTGNSDGNQPAKFFLVALFNRELTESEMQSLHTDWFGTLFNGDVTATGAGATVTTAAPAGSAAGTVIASGSIGTVTASSPSGSASNVIATINENLIFLTGASEPNVTGITAIIYKALPTSATAPHKVLTNVSSDGSGAISIDIRDIGLISGQTVWLFLAKDGASLALSLGGAIKILPTYTS